MTMNTLHTALRLLLVTTIFGLLGSSLSSCRTTRGFGQDLQHLGSKIERKASQVGRY